MQHGIHRSWKVAGRAIATILVGGYLIALVCGYAIASPTDEIAKMTECLKGKIAARIKEKAMNR